MAAAAAGLGFCWCVAFLFHFYFISCVCVCVCVCVCECVCVCFLTTPPTTRTPMEVREVREARPVTMETISSSWVMELCGNGGMLVLTGVRAMGRGTCRENTAETSTEHRERLRELLTVLQEEPNSISAFLTTLMYTETNYNLARR